MANVQVHVTNNSGKKVGLTLDEDADLLKHLQKMQRREELAKVEVTSLTAMEAGPFDPTARTAPEVLAHLAEADEDERERVLAAERAGKNRKGIVGDGAPSPNESDLLSGDQE